MVRKIFCLSLALMLVALAVPAMASTSVWVETPAADGAVNLRSGPGTEYPVIGWAVYGDELVLLSAGNQWYQVQIVKNGKIGFMSKEYISFDKPSRHAFHWHDRVDFHQNGQRFCEHPHRPRHGLWRDRLGAERR